MQHDERNQDAGFTLIELVITVVIMTVVLGALAMGVVTLLRTTGVTTDRLVGSHDAQLLSEWITTDIQSAASAPVKNVPPGCADDASLPAGTNVAQMTWKDPTTGLPYHVGYRTQQVRVGPPAVWQLVRYFCLQGQSSTHFPVVHALKNGEVCSDGVAGTSAVCVLNQPPPPPLSPRFDLQIVTVSGTQSYTFTATATWRTATSGVDGTRPQMTSVVAYNTDNLGNAGLIKRVVVTFDEPLDLKGKAPSQWTLTSPPNGAAISDVAIVNNAVVLTLSASGSPTVTSTGGFTLGLTADPTGVRDGAGNLAVPFTAQPVADGMAPVILSAIAVDGSGDGNIDQIDITPSEPIESAIPNPASRFHLVSADPAWASVFISGASVSSSNVALTLGNTPPGSAVPNDLTVAMDADPSAVRDTSPAHNFTAWPPTNVTDDVPPSLVSITSGDGDQNGTLDQIVATFSESVVASTNPTQWTLTRPLSPTPWPSAPKVSAVSVSGPQVTLTIDPFLTGGQPVPVDTEAAGLQVSTPAGIDDSSGNTLPFNNLAVTDHMAPVVTNMLFSPNPNAGLFETSDSLTVTFSEQLASSSATTPTVTLDWQAGKPDATVDVPGLTAGPVDVGTGGYFTADGNDATWSATVNRSGATVIVLLTGACTGAGCANLSPGPSALTVLKVSPLLTDLAGNAALNASVTIQWF